MLQSIAQLNARYGRDYAQSIQGGFHTVITYAGSDPETTLFFERVIGRQRVYQVSDYLNHMEHYREQNLMNTNEIRTMKSEEVLIVSGNQDPILIPSKGYFQVWWMKRATKRLPALVEGHSASPLEYVVL